jgi:SpoVK/Ycf46/Vps4 family AAA+-type ATPase
MFGRSSRSCARRCAIAARSCTSGAFDRRLTLGKGLYALFIGPSGTGKTLAAEVIAHALEFDLLKIDLSAVVSKYIGETEKNLQRVFDSADRADCILFFDEADALFGKRSEIKDAHDRYANIEVNFLLQRLEEYQGVAILASNLAQNIDEAFARRLQFTVEFPFPDERLRLAIWRNHFPKEAPVATELDLEYFAREFKISGASIRKIVLNAAFLAADEGKQIGPSHLLRRPGANMSAWASPIWSASWRSCGRRRRRDRRPGDRDLRGHDAQRRACPGDHPARLRAGRRRFR